MFCISLVDVFITLKSSLAVRKADLKKIYKSHKLFLFSSLFLLHSL